MFTWVVASSLVMGAPALKDKRKPTKPPAGEWVMVELVADGRSAKLSPVKHYTARFSATDYHLRFGEAKVGSYSAAWFDAGGTLQADFEYGTPKGTWKAIWKIEDDTLTICEARPGEPRPSDYTAPPESGRTRTVLRRIGD